MRNGPEGGKKITELGNPGAVNEEEESNPKCYCREGPSYCHAGSH